MIQFQEEVLIEARPSIVFGRYADVAGWKDWDPDVEQASLEGPFQAGVDGTLTPAGGPETRIRLIEVRPDSSFAVVSRLPLCTMRFDHELASRGARTLARHRVTFSGPLSFLFGRVVGKQIRLGLPGTLQGLKKACEAS
jgi:hypothetical protein